MNACNTNPTIWHHRFADKAYPLVVAHRGASAVAPENTRAAFDAALLAKADAIETDLRLTADGVLVCLHDAAIVDDRGVARAISELKRAELYALRPAVPDFAEVAAQGVALYLDAKVEGPLELARLLEVAGPVQRDWLIGAPDLAAAAHMALHFPELRQVGLMRDLDVISAFANSGSDRWIRVHEARANDALIEGLRGLGLRVMITCGGEVRPTGDADAQSLVALLLLEPDALIVNDPVLALTIVRRPEHISQEARSD